MFSYKRATLQAILDQKKIDRVGTGVREGQNMAQNGPLLWLRSPLEAPKWVKDPGNGPRMVPPPAPDLFVVIPCNLCV